MFYPHDKSLHFLTLDRSLKSSAEDSISQLRRVIYCRKDMVAFGDVDDQLEADSEESTILIPNTSVPLFKFC
jgi:hypothetical protein